MATAEPQRILGRIAQIAIVVRDLDRAEAFYRDVLGMRHLFRVPNLSFFDCDGVRLMLGRAEAAEFERASSILYYQVSGLEHVYDTLRARGVVFRDPPHKVADLGERELWMAFFEDGEGNVAAAIEEKPKS